MMELIQYARAHDRQGTYPLIIFYAKGSTNIGILDMRPITRFVKYAVDQGYTVFMISMGQPRSNV